MKQLNDFFADKSIQNVLDIGTGSGEFVQLLKAVFPEEASIIGIDPNEEVLVQARKEVTGKNILFQQMEGEKLLFDDHSFDVVCISNALHHLADVKQTLSEMKRIVRSDGWLIIAEIASDGLNPAQENQKMLHHFKSYVDRMHGITHHETWTKNEILEIVKNNGIEVVLSFPFNRMNEPVTDPEKLAEWISRYEEHIVQLEGHPEHAERAASLALFKERLHEFGFQLAEQIVVVGQVRY